DRSHGAVCALAHTGIEPRERRPDPGPAHAGGSVQRGAQPHHGHPLRPPIPLELHSRPAVLLRQEGPVDGLDGRGSTAGWAAPLPARYRDALRARGTQRGHPRSLVFRLGGRHRIGVWLRGGGGVMTLSEFFDCCDDAPVAQAFATVRGHLNRHVADLPNGQPYSEWTLRLGKGGPKPDGGFYEGQEQSL